MWVRGLKYGTRQGDAAIYVSHPMWVRGLKFAYPSLPSAPSLVAPHVGAWIEIQEAQGSTARQGRSHPMWVRGLKLALLVDLLKAVASHPMWVRGLK